MVALRVFSSMVCAMPQCTPAAAMDHLRRRQLGMGVVVPMILLATQGLIFSPYWVKVRGDSYGPLYSRQRDVLGNEENVYVWDYHMDIYNPMSAALVLGLTTAFLCVLSFIYNNLFEHNFRRKIVALIFSFSFLGFQTAISVLPTTIHTAKLWWTYYVYVSLGVLCSVVFILLTGMDYTAKIKDSKAE